MTTVLAQRDGEWFLAAFAKHLNGCNLSTPREPVLQREKFHLWRGQLYVQSHASLQGITFYPELYYHGMKVWPQGWGEDTAEPILHCLVLLNPEDVERTPYFDGPSAKQIHATKDRDRDEWIRLLALRQKGVEQLIERLIADGWEQPGRGEFTRLVHIDDLDKIEGPPPEGPF